MVDRNAMTFVPIGWNVVLWGVKTWLELGQVIGEDNEAEQVSESKRHKIQKGLQKSQSQMLEPKAGPPQRRTS